MRVVWGFGGWESPIRHTFLGLATNMTCVMAAGGRMGLKGGNSDADGG